MNSDRYCDITFFGYLLGQLRGVELKNQSLTIFFKSHSETYALDELTCIPQIKKGLFGSTVYIEIGNKKLNCRYLKSGQLFLLLDSITLTLIASSKDRIGKVHADLQKAAINRYLRDSDLSALSPKIETVVNIYAPIKEKLSSDSAQLFESIAKINPLKEHSKSLRSEYENTRNILRKSFFDRVESNPLTDQQRMAVIRENDRNLVLAAAGTGKTSVMVAKALDLVDSGSLVASEILVLAYNKAATIELKERMIKRSEQTGIDPSAVPDIYTFHALGRKILVDSGVKPSLSKFTEDPLELRLWVSDWFVCKMKEEPGFMSNFIDLMYVPVNIFDFKSKDDYDRYICDNDYRTLQGELVRGYQELLIANWLFLHNVPYEYEAQYVTKRRIEVEFDYKPDFHLVGTDIYIEHFGIDRNGNTAPWIDRDDYNSKIRQKRELHSENETVLLETYHYDWLEDSLEERLSALLSEHSIQISEKRPEEVYETLNEKKVLLGVLDRYLKCLGAIRVERLNGQSILDRLISSAVPKAEKYQALLTELHDAYRLELFNRKEIDFDDMIIRATELVEREEFKPQWKYILVDEFQDISMARMQLIKSLVAKGPNPILTVVGDDWQSIYRFSGGKLELTTRFDELVGSHSTTKLEKTFRYNSSIAHTAGTFIMANPEQYRKNVVTAEVSSSPQVFLLDSKLDDSDNLEAKASRIIQKILSNEPNAKVAVLARYNYLLDNTKKYVRQRKVKGVINFWTFHSSKGLEADYCVLIGFFQGKKGFPNKNREESVVEALLPSLDGFEHSEERRLLYVALTRAKKQCYIIGDPTSPSEFILELLSPKYEVKIASKTFEERYRETFKCPNCSSGYYQLLSSEYGQFYRCSTGVSCQSKPRICSQCGSPSIDKRGVSICQNSACRHETKICPKCGRPMKHRKGKYGQFWGCSGYGISDDQCKHTEKI